MMRYRTRTDKIIILAIIIVVVASILYGVLAMQSKDISDIERALFPDSPDNFFNKFYRPLAEQLRSP